MDFSFMMVTMTIIIDISQNCYTFENIMSRTEERQKGSWRKIIEDKVLIPANSIKLFYSHGKLVGRMVYRDNEVTYVPQVPLQELSNCSPLFTLDGAHSLSGPQRRGRSHLSSPHSKWSPLALSGRQRCGRSHLSSPHSK